MLYIYIYIYINLLIIFYILEIIKKQQCFLFFNNIFLNKSNSIICI